MVPLILCGLGKNRSWSTWKTVALSTAKFVILFFKTNDNSMLNHVPNAAFPNPRPARSQSLRNSYFRALGLTTGLLVHVAFALCGDVRCTTSPFCTFFGSMLHTRSFALSLEPMTHQVSLFIFHSTCVLRHDTVFRARWCDIAGQCWLGTILLQARGCGDNERRYLDE